MMKRACGLILAMAMLLCACGPAAAESAATAEFTVQGSAQMMADPDMVSVTANTSVTAGTVGSAQEEMNKIVASATDKLLELGVLDDDIVTTNYSYYPRYNYDTNTITGYEANHTLVITCRDVDMLDGVIGVLTDSGFSQIYSVNYDVSTRGELYQQALEMAIQQAESKAGQMAAASGMTVTGLKSLVENGGYAVEYRANSDATTLKAEEAGGTGIRSGSVSVSASVTAVYEATK